MGLLSEFLKINPVFKQLFGLFNLRVFCQVFGVQEVQGFLKLIKLQHNRVGLCLDLFDTIDNTNQSFNF